jgi:hypothetical protein
LIKRLQRPEGSDPQKAAQMAYNLLRFMAKEGAPMFKSHVAELVIVMSDKKNHRLAEVALQGLAAVAKANQDDAPDDRYGLAVVVSKGFRLSSSQASGRPGDQDGFGRYPEAGKVCCAFRRVLEAERRGGRTRRCERAC